MDTGTKISAAGHGILLLWVLVGPVFRSAPEPMMVREVSVVSSQEFAALQSRRSAPDLTSEIDAPQAPSATEGLKDPVPQTAPEASARPPDAPTVATPPTPPEPEIAPDLPVADAPPPSEDLAVLAPDVTPDPAPQQADRVAPTPEQPPAPEALPDDVRRDEVTEDSTGDVEQTPQDATAPPEATTQIVTEADRPSRAPDLSRRPPSLRPSPPTAAETPQPAEPAPAPETLDQSAEDPLAAAVAEAVSEAVSEGANVPATETAPAAPVGPPLTGSEREGLRVSVSSCWNVGTLSTEAQGTTVTVYMRMNRDGTPDNSSIRLLSREGGDADAAQRVFDTARSAIIRCGRDGFPLPVEKYALWREIEMRFNPEGMFLR